MASFRRGLLLAACVILLGGPVAAAERVRLGDLDLAVPADRAAARARIDAAALRECKAAARRKPEAFDLVVRVTTCGQGVARAAWARLGAAPDSGRR